MKDYDVLAGRAATFSKGPEFFGVEFEPSVVTSGQGAYVFDCYGQRWLDWISSLGALILGHPNPHDRLYPDPREAPANKWARAVCHQVWSSAGFSLPHRLERETAERLVDLLSAHVPGWQGQRLGLRWGKTGSDACSMAVRLARAVTGWGGIVSVGYHGWHDKFVSLTPPAWGVVYDTDGSESMHSVPYGDVIRLHEWLEIYKDPAWAAVIIEQPPQPVPAGYWQEVRRLCTEYGALLILDEVVTGLRYGLGGAAERFGIEPDIICMGKALGNGMPISCIVGRREYFEWFSRNDPVFVSSTSFGEAVSLAACNAVLNVWDQSCVDHLWAIGGALMEGLAKAGYQVTGYPPVSLVQHETPSHRAYFIREMARRGILMNRPNIPNLAHTMKDVGQTITAAAAVKRAMGKVEVEVEMAGKLPQVLFSNR